MKTRGEREGTRENKRRPELSSKREAWQDADETDAQGQGRELVQVAPNRGAGGSHLWLTSDQKWAQVLCEIRRLVKFLGRETSRRQVVCR